MQASPLVDNQLWILGPVPALAPSAADVFAGRFCCNTLRASVYSTSSAARWPDQHLPEARKVKWVLDVDPIEG